MHAYNCPENKIEFIFEATWGDSVAVLCPQNLGEDLKFLLEIGPL